MITSKLKLLLFIFILLIVGIVWVTLTQRQYSTNTRAYADVPDSPTPIPPAIILGEMVTEVMDSPDGTQSLTMERRVRRDGIEYSFFISKSSEDHKEFLYAKELSITRNMSIPYNTWSPDNKYIFLKESDSTQDEYYVFYASGENFPNYTQYLNVQKLFEEKVDGYFITDVTGWAAPTLLIVNTQEKEGDGKVSFWLDVRNQSFIRLGTYFR